ncbi:EAL domain-containing protein [Modestobacter versicolor]|uniref:Diguanylate cyclase (GGDEF)-like protein/PAS domain S-box-containing protein n=1 Tax=Modestobacter versicolor TaxID=429133 RepID=A0A323V9S1_9ACTN|nr:EAL domain-containing protein [Modestobacter versicolor]MBB3676027.1 diguanylate cyclase (GGDEF)-like protein/PAS domain S-box-containing protein [Modestobacter versicolor]PZA21499.1 GGDEF domain-containing protein [Modestobacter versicolor]
MTTTAPESSGASGPTGSAGQRLRAADVLLADRGQLFRALFLSAPVAKAVVDPAGRLLVVNPAMCELTGRSSAELVGRHLDLLTHPDDVPLEDRATEHVPGTALLDPQLEVVGERRLRRADGESIWVHQSQDLVHRTNGEPQFVVLTLVDVTDRRRAEEDLVRRAFTDPLTGLPNRRALTERLQHALAASRRRGTLVGLLHLDLDRFTAVNDSLGHEGGDQLLCQVADRLRWSTRVEDTAVRFGADEFLVLADEVEDVEALRTLADRLLGVLDEPFHVHDREITLSASVGMTLGSDLAPEALLRQAHSALARAKASGGRGRVEVHDEALGEGYVDQLQLETDLRHALEAGELRLFYQPIVALSDEHLLGYEALIRWQHPTRGLLPPGAFLSAAEDNRLTSRLGAWVLHQACWDAAGWDSDLRVHVNISARHLAEPGFSELVADALAESGLAPERLELEITESTALFAADATLHAVDTVTETGVTLALDDFGTGYSAITALHRLPIHTVKIDRSFVADVVTEPATAALVQGLLQLGQGMGLQVIAEGIEDGEQARWLREHGCAMAQGYAFGRPAPLPARELDQLSVPIDPADVVDPPAPHLGAGPDAAPTGELGDLAEDEWGPEADTGPTLRSAAVPQLDAFTLPATGVLPAQPVDPGTVGEPVTGELPELADGALVSPDDVTAPAEAELPYESVAALESPSYFDARGSFDDAPAYAEVDDEDADDEPTEPAGPTPGFDPGVFRPSRAFLELRELLAANGAPDTSAVPEPREPLQFGDLRSLAADPTDFSGLRPWLESFQQRLGPPSTGDLPQVGDRA